MNICIGTQGTYELTAKIGTGGNGEVWRSKGPNGEVAIKLLKKVQSALPDSFARFGREIEALRRLHGVKGVLPLLDAAAKLDSHTPPWFAMPVATLLRKRLGDMASLREICSSMAEIAAALDQVHQRGISHRDIKPDNLYWYGGNWCIGDFGLADFQESEPITRSDRKLGPAYYIAPEMLNSPKTADGARADIYSLAKTIWVLATGQNYPMPGVHDPTHDPISVKTFRDDRRAAPLDELLRRMTHLEPGRRPMADWVARELAILSGEDSVNVAPNPSSALGRLRVALVPHFTQESEELHQKTLAEATAHQMRQAIEEISEEIANQTNLSRESWYLLPGYWGFRPHSGSPLMSWEDEFGYAFEAGLHG